MYGIGSMIEVRQYRKSAKRGSGPFGFGLLLTILALGFAGCSGGGADAEPGRAFTGEIVEVLTDEGALVVEHEELGDLPGGATKFRVSAGDLANAEVGRRIRARLVEQAGERRLVRIWPVDRMAEGIIEQSDIALREDTINRGSAAFREVGEEVPEFALYDQSGEVVRSSRYRGKKVVLNFIYTRCPSPEMCPAATQRMKQLQDAAREAGIGNFELVSITLDPDYDTPGVLREYAKQYGIDTANFSFLTGPDSAIANLMEQFGILIDPTVGVEAHTLGTMLVDETGTIRHRVFGSNWMVGDFLQRLKALETDAS